MDFGREGLKDELNLLALNHLIVVDAMEDVSGEVIATPVTEILVKMVKRVNNQNIPSNIHYITVHLYSLVSHYMSLLGDKMRAC